jgi:hypothetical protein
MSDAGLTVPGMAEPPRRYDVTITVDKDADQLPSRNTAHASTDQRERERTQFLPRCDRAAACATGFAWMYSWQSVSAQTMMVLGRIRAISAAHAGCPGLGWPSWLSPATWWTITVVPRSQSRCSLRISSLRG